MARISLAPPPVIVAEEKEILWTEERMALLRREWIEGATTREIAKTLGPQFTRNSVIGKANRMGLPARRAAPSSKRQKPLMCARGWR